MAGTDSWAANARRELLACGYDIRSELGSGTFRGQRVCVVGGRGAFDKACVPSLSLSALHFTAERHSASAQRLVRCSAVAGEPCPCKHWFVVLTVPQARSASCTARDARRTASTTR